MTKLYNLVLLSFQVGLTFILTLVIYMFFALLDSDFGIDGIFGLLIIQPILGSIISVLTILTLTVVGLPFRLNQNLKKWWTDNFFIAPLGIITGLILLVISTIPQLSETTRIELNGQEILKQIPNTYLSYSGWFVTAFMTLHLFPPESQRKKLENIIKKWKNKKGL